MLENHFWYKHKIFLSFNWFEWLRTFVNFWILLIVKVRCVIDLQHNFEFSLALVRMPMKPDVLKILMLQYFNIENTLILSFWWLSNSAQHQVSFLWGFSVATQIFVCVVQATLFCCFPASKLQCLQILVKIIGEIELLLYLVYAWSQRRFSRLSELLWAWSTYLTGYNRNSSTLPSKPPWKRCWSFFKGFSRSLSSLGEFSNSTAHCKLLISIAFKFHLRSSYQWPSAVYERLFIKIVERPRIFEA